MDYNPTGAPVFNSSLASSAIRSEFTLVATAVNSKLDETNPTVTNGFTITNPTVGVAIEQVAHQTMAQLAEITPAEASAAKFQMQMQSFNNPAPQSSTVNNGVWIGWNACRHTGGTGVVAGQHALAMGFESSYFDAGGDDEFACEWYVEGWSPDGTTVQMSRPFYARGSQQDDGTDWWTILCDIGAGGALGQFTVRSKTVSLFNITSTSIYNQLPLQQTGNITINAGDLLLDNAKYIRLKSAAGSYVSMLTMDGSNNIQIGDIFNQVGGNVYLKSGGLTALALAPTGVVTAYSTINMTTATVSGTCSAATLSASASIQLANNKYFQVLNSALSPCSVIGAGTDNKLYFGDIFNNLAASVYIRSGGADTLTLETNGNVTTRGNVVVGAELVVSNSRYLQTQKVDLTPVPLMGIDNADNLLIGDPYNHMTTDVALMSAGKNTILMTPAGDVKLYGYTGESVGANVASATTITPTGPIFHVTGVTAIATINLPFVGFTGSITIIPDGIFATTTAGNIALGSTAVVKKALIMTFDGTLWYPSY